MLRKGGEGDEKSVRSREKIAADVFFTDFAEKGLTERGRISIILFVILYDSDTPASWRMGGK